MAQRAGGGQKTFLKKVGFFLFSEFTLALPVVYYNNIGNGNFTTPYNPRY